ncbi:MAG: MFS transporter [Candidatus Zixiibacteriota bacterium]|nr:MAG: MFS transporter [candidate division Zixibacteria bacterium]
MKDTIRIYSATRFLVAFAFGTILPVYVLYFRHYQMNLFEIALLAAVFEASILLFEMPTGLVADMYGRRISVILSAAFSLIAGFLFIFFPFLAGFLIAEILAGFGETLRSGALEAWLVDSLKHEGKEEKVKSAFAAGTKFKSAGNLLGLILGGYLASLNMKLVWVPFTALFLILCLFLILKMKEKYQLEGKVSGKVKSRLSETIRQSIHVLRSQRLILALLILFLLSEFAFETISQFWQVHFHENLSIATQYFGWIAAIAFLLTILFIDKVTALSGKLRRETSSLIILESLFLVSLLALALAGSPVLAVTLFIVIHSFVNFKEPIFLDLYNKRIPSVLRATLLSFQGLVGSTGEVLAGLCIGIIAIKFGLRITFGFGTVLLFVGIVAFLLLATSRPRRSGA